MKNPERHTPGFDENETGDHLGEIRVAPVSRVMVPRLAEIDATWNSNPWKQSSFEVELANPASSVVGAYRDELLVGYLIAHVVIDEAHIVSIGVAPEWRRQGVGSVLLTEALDALRQRGVAVVTLEVRVSNTAARSLYHRGGFEAVGRRKEYYSNNGEDAVIMRRSL